MIGYLGLGSNVGERRARLTDAVAALPRHDVAVLASSSVYETEPVGLVLDQPWFMNACLQISTDCGPEELLDACKAVEREVGRATGGERHGPRVIDVDVLLLGKLRWRSERVTLPHESLAERRFVLVALLELDPELALPEPDCTRLAELLAALGSGQAVRRAGPPLLGSGQAVRRAGPPLL